MKFIINNRNWEILEVDHDKMLEVRELKEHELEKGSKFFGLCSYSTQKIYIWDALHPEQKRFTLMHELSHCYIGSYMSAQEITFNEEMFCDMSANSHDIIHEIVTKYFEEVKDEN